MKWKGKDYRIPEHPITKWLPTVLALAALIKVFFFS